MIDFRKVIVAIVIAVLFTIFVFTTIQAVYPKPLYQDFCEDQFYPTPLEMKSPTDMTDADREAYNLEQKQNQEEYTRCNAAYETENDKYKCKGCGNIIVADPRELPQFCPECGTEYSYMKILPAI